MIADFAAYPTWAKGVTDGRGRRRASPDGRAEQVFFELDVGADQGRVHARLRLGRRPTRSPGPWSRARCCARSTAPTCCADRGDGTTEVTYRLALDVSIPLIGMLKRKGEKILIDTALKGLKKRVESLG